MNTSRPIPLRPDYSARTRSTTNSTLMRAIHAHLHARLEQSAPVDVAAEIYDRDVELLTRASVNPSSTVVDANAGVLVQTAVADTLGGLGAASAMGPLFAANNQLEFGRSSAFFVPGFTASATVGGYVEQGKPIGAAKLSAGGITLSQKKFGVVVPFTYEFSTYSVRNALKLITVTVNDSFGLALDTVALDANAATVGRPAGLRYGIDALTGTPSSNTNLFEAMIEDTSRLAASVSAVANNGPIIFICSPRQAVSLRLRARGVFPYEVLASSGLADRTVVALAPNALASAIGPTPRVDVSSQTSYHEDTIALPINSGTTTTPLPAAPIRSTFQTATLALRLIIDLDFGLRAAGGLAWAQNVIW